MRCRFILEVEVYVGLSGIYMARTPAFLVQGCRHHHIGSIPEVDVGLVGIYTAMTPVLFVGWKVVDIVTLSALKNVCGFESSMRHGFENLSLSLTQCLVV